MRKAYCPIQSKSLCKITAFSEYTFGRGMRRFFERNEFMKITAVIVAAGSGRRMGAGRNKVFLELGGRTVLENTVAVFENCGIIDEITVVTGEIEECRELLSGFAKVKNIVSGGKTRQESVKNGLKASPCDIVVIHDGARALILEKEIEAAVEAANKYGAAAVGVKCKDTLKSADTEGFISATLDREFIYNIQTPQVFRYSEIKQLHENVVDNSYTDDCAIAEEFGIRIKIVDGNYDNIKITTPDDMVIAENILKKRGHKK